MSGSLLNTVKFLACILIMLIECGLVIYGWLSSIIRSTWPAIILVVALLSYWEALSLVMDAP